MDTTDMVKMRAQTTYYREGFINPEQITAIEIVNSDLLNHHRGIVQDRLARRLIEQIQKVGGPWGMTIGPLQITEESAFVGEFPRS